MDHKPHKPKAKTMDVAPPRPAHASAASLVIPTRAVIKDESNTNTPDAETATPASQPKRRTIAPVDANTTDAAEPAVSSQSTGQESSPEAAQPSEQPTPTKPTEELSDEHATDKAPAGVPAPAAASDTNVTKQPTQPNPSTNAAVPTGTAQAKNAKPDEISKAVERERQLQEYINNRKYFVPIRTAARERSIKRSLFLTLFVLVLAVVLVDLMLDTGIILLIQKIPHTHFFNLGG